MTNPSNNPAYKFLDNLRWKQGIFFAIIWFLVLLLGTGQYFFRSLLSAFYFFIGWLTLSLILDILCEFKVFCIPY